MNQSLNTHTLTNRTQNFGMKAFWIIAFRTSINAFGIDPKELLLVNIHSFETPNRLPNTMRSISKKPLTSFSVGLVNWYIAQFNSFCVRSKRLSELLVCSKIVRSEFEARCFFMATCLNCLKHIIKDNFSGCIRCALANNASNFKFLYFI